MGQLVTRPTGRGVKTDTNPNYQTYGNDNDVDYIQDFNGQYQPSDYDEMYEETSIRRSTLPGTGPKVKSIDAGLLFKCVNLILQAIPVKKSRKVLFCVAASLVVLLALLATGAILVITRRDTQETSRSTTTNTTPLIRSYVHESPFSYSHRCVWVDFRSSRTSRLIPGFLLQRGGCISRICGQMTTPHLHLVEIVKFAHSCEIQSYLWNSVILAKSSHSCEIQP